MKNYKIFEAFATNSTGVWFFVPEGGAFKAGSPCKGFGAIKYPEGSVYTGDLFYDGKHFNKIGSGRQDFTRSGIGDTIKSIGEKRYMFVGRYDYRKTDWIYGNGVLYYTDEAGKPTHFVKGFFKGLQKTGDYRGEFDYGALLDGYTADMEFDYDESAVVLENRWKAIAAELPAAKVPYTLFIGDSYFELFSDKSFAGVNTFDKFFDGSCVNAGICGTRFSDWLKWTDKLKGATAPEKIVINLGFNDLHNGASVDETYARCKKFTRAMRGLFPDAKIYSICVVHAPESARFFEEENEYNSRLLETAEKLGVEAADWNGIIERSGKNCFHADEIHPGEYGYGLFAAFLRELVDR